MATRETADTHASGRSSRLWLAVALTTLLVGLGLSAFTALGWSARQRRDGRQGFDSTAQSVSGTVGTLVRADVTFVASLRTVLTMQPHLSPTAFDDWYERLEVTQRQVGGIGSGVVDSVPAGQLTRFQIPRDSDRAFQRLVGGRIEVVTPDGRRRQCLLAAARIAVPIAGPFAQLAQSDLCSPHSLAGSYEAPLLSELTDSGRFVVAPVVAAWLRTTLFEMAFYRRGVPLRTVAQRRSAVAGWLVSSFDLPTLITQAIGGNHGLQVELMFTEPDGRATLLATGGDAGARGRLSQTTTVAVDGDWTVVVRGAPVVSGLSAQSGGILVFLSGAAITVLLSLLLLTLSRSRERALAMVAEKTAQLRHQALHDALTGLPNRVLVLDRAEQMLARALRSRTPIALLYIDVDGFKHINDTFGHAIGDRFLQLVAARLLSVVRESDTAARLGGDEFIVLLEGASIETGPEAVAERVLDVLREPYDLTRELGRQLTVSASIGVAFGQPETAEALLADGDVALYAAKEGGKNRFAVFAPGMQTPAHDRIRLELDLAEAIDQDQLFLVYQPTFDLSSGRATAVEALLRWRHPVRGVIAPDVLIPIAEGAGLIVEIGRWVLAQACGQAVAWHAEGHTVSVSVNVSSRQLDRDQLTDDVREALQRTGLEPSWLTLEITEPALLREPDATARRLAALKRLGVRIAIDDFGTGHSSIAYLRQFPVDTLKIDSSFVGMIGSSTEALAIVDTLIDIGRTLALQTVGEGIEDPEQLELLQRAGCDAGQGFLFTRPLDPEDLGRFLDASERAPAATAAGQS